MISYQSYNEFDSYRNSVGHGQMDRFFAKAGIVSKFGQQWRWKPQCPGTTPLPPPGVSLAQLWFAWQMSQVHLSFGLHSAIIIRVLHSPSSPLTPHLLSQPNDWLLPGSRRRRSSLQKHKGKANARKTSEPWSKRHREKATFAALSMWFNCAHQYLLPRHNTCIGEF